MIEDEEDEDDEIEEMIEEKEEEREVKVKERIVEKVVEKIINEREKMKNRSKGYKKKDVVGGKKVYLRKGEFGEGRIGEILIEMKKEGDELREMMNNFEIEVQIGMKYGVKMEEYVEELKLKKFEKDGMVIGKDEIKKDKQIIEYVLREIEV